MGDAVEGIRLHSGIVNHIFENHLITYLQSLRELPIAHKVACQTAVAAKTVGWLLAISCWLLAFDMFSATDFREIGHFQTIRHVTGKADIEDSRTDALVLNNIDHRRHQWTCLPGESAARLKDDLQMRITLVESLHDAYQTLNVIIGTGHQMAPTEIDPLNLREPTGELFFYMLQRTLENIRATLAMTMAMEAMQISRQHIRQLIGSNAKTRTWGTGVI